MLQTQPAFQTQSTDAYQASFERFEQNGGQTPPWIFPIRKAALARFAERGFPTLKDEDWRFTNVSPITKLPFRPVFEYSKNGILAESLNQITFASIKTNRLVFVNGHFAAELSNIQPQVSGVQITSLAAGLQSDSLLLQKHLARYARTDRNPFAALNTAFFSDGAFIYIPKGKVIDHPIHLVFIGIAHESGTTAHPRNLLIAESGAQVTVLENYTGVGESPYFTNAVTEMVVSDGAVVEHCKFQDENVNAFHMAALHAQLGRNCNFVSHSISTGARLARNNINTVLDGEGVECILNGLYLVKDEQLVDHFMIVEHAKPHCNSHEYYNGILDGRAKGVFHGRILVQPEAQKTDAKQTNKNLLLSDGATIDTKPQLEIYADDVKCTHGATVGQLNEDSIFYLRSRGIGYETARQMLIHSFAGEIIGRIRCEPARKELDDIIWNRLEQNPNVAVSRKE